MRVTLTKITLETVPSQNQVIHLAWKIDGEPDSAYRILPDCTVDINGNILFPTPYQFVTGTLNEDIFVQAIAACDPTYITVVRFEGLNLCCPAGYTISPNGLQCSLTQTAVPTVVQAGVCVACSQLSPEYGLGTRFWPNPDFDLNLTAGSGSMVTLSTPYWSGSPAGSASRTGCGDTTAPVVGNPPSPVNRQGVWVDTNCDGVKNALSGGAALQFSWVIQATNPRTVYVGMSGDNNFSLSHNGTVIAQRLNTSLADNFFFLYLFPVTLISGPNTFGARFVGDGSVNDMGAMIIIDNPAAQIPGITNDGQIQYAFQSSQLIGQPPFNIVTCPAGFAYDSQNDICTRTLTVNSTPCP